MLVRSLLLILFVLTGTSVSGQIGIRATYNVNQVPTWNQFFEEVNDQNQSIFSKSIGFSLDYWMRMKNVRIEFYPYLSYHQANETINGNGFAGPNSTSPNLSLRQFGIGLNTHFYLFDFLGDCECPTFSKQGGIMKKGFFLMVGGGIDMSQKKIADFEFRDSNLDLKFSGGAGFDIGLSDLITVSPFINYQYFPSVSWHELGTYFGKTPEHIESSMSQLQFGLRLGFRPDYKN